MSDFRHRFGRQLADAARRLVADGAPRDFRDRLGAQLTAAAAELASARAPARATRARVRWRRPVAAPDFRARFGGQLALAAAGLAAERAPLAAPARRRRASRIPRLAPVRLARPLAIGLSLAVLGGAAAASSLWLVQVGNPNYGHGPGVSSTAPPASELDALAVLRRPQSDADRGPGVQAALQDVNDFTTGVRTSYVRVLATTSAGPVVLIPVAERTAVLTGTGSAQPSIPDALCVYFALPDGASDLPTRAQCWTSAQLLAGQALAAVGLHVFGLAPDGAASATVQADGTTVTAPVANNFFDATLPDTGSTGPSPAPHAVVAPIVTFSPAAP